MKKIIAPLILLFCTNIAFSQSLPGSGNAVDFSGGNAIINIYNFPQLNIPLTFSAWIKVEPGITGQTVFLSDANTIEYRGFWVLLSPDLKIQLSLQGQTKIARWF